MSDDDLELEIPFGKCKSNDDVANSAICIPYNFKDKRRFECNPNFVFIMCGGVACECTMYRRMTSIYASGRRVGCKN